MTSRDPYRRHSTPFKLQLRQDIRAGVIGRRDAQRTHQISANLIREIARRTGLSWNTIKKYLKVGTMEPKFTVPECPDKLDPFADKLAAWLKTEASKSRKQRRPLTHLHADLAAQGFAGSYNRVAAFAREWRMERNDNENSRRRDAVPLRRCRFGPERPFSPTAAKITRLLGVEPSCR